MRLKVLMGAAVAVLALSALAAGTASAGGMVEAGYCEEPTVAEEAMGVRGGGDHTPAEIREARALYNARRCATTLVPASQSDAATKAITDCMIAKGDTVGVDLAVVKGCITGLGYVLKQDSHSVAPLRHAKHKRRHGHHVASVS